MFDWVFRLPLPAQGVLVVGGTVLYAVAGTLLTRRWVRRAFRPQPEMNDVVSYFMSGFGLIYGITLGLVAVATFQAYNETEGVVGREAAALAGLYRDVSAYPEPARGELQGQLREYARYVIDEAWPAQARGEVPEGGVALMDAFQDKLMAFEPINRREDALHANALRQYNSYLDLRRQRLQKVTGRLPGVMWFVTLLGAALYVFLTWLLVIDSAAADFLLSAVTATIVGLLVFLIVALDRPFQGENSVGVEPFELVYKTLMDRP